jgi:hypothetical protein
VGHGPALRGCVWIGDCTEAPVSSAGARLQIRDHWIVNDALTVGLPSTKIWGAQANKLAIV